MTPDVLALLDAAAERHGIEAALLRGVAWVESRGYPYAISSAGAMGVMQLMPKTAEGLNVRDPFDAAQNIEGGTRMLARLVDELGVEQALAAYNWGPGNVRSGRALPASVRAYVAKVLAAADSFRAGRAPVADPRGPRSAAGPLSRLPLGSLCSPRERGADD